MLKAEGDAFFSRRLVVWFSFISSRIKNIRFSPNLALRAVSPPGKGGAVSTKGRTFPSPEGRLYGFLNDKRDKNFFDV